MTKKDSKRFTVASSEYTKDFYNNLMTGEEKRSFLGKDARYNPINLMNREIVRSNFLKEITPLLNKEDKVLDFGCGPGTFTFLASKHCKEIKAVDISSGFIKEAKHFQSELEIDNIDFSLVEPNVLPFEDESFDAVLLMDVIHHLEDIEAGLKEVLRVLKKDGKILVFEPNKLNPLIYLVHLLDKTEWGLLQLGTPAKYRSIMKGKAEIAHIRFNGIVIGPDSLVFNLISKFLNLKILSPLIGWLNPKIFVYARKQ
ncbi:class I SAM-dependent methyltransferase [Halobacteriovorax sp. GB3]|uniref:class I SAM-dependent methyltransferase n=1 Tax=Halobacteriovorax sp. GB3 TaxID=2719615 RepID=UPI002362425E|nr:class I SAM-dependent methyltransferase [Halobacteriovorax sp. GB3]MDD0852507.1 class I SAM-dependent methyltransferase [Halobacteriovorax sp. GB3]